MTESRTITGHTVVMVRTKDGDVPLHRGDTLPDNLADGELARLEKVGAFAQPPVADLAAQGAQPVVLISPALGYPIGAQEALQAAPDAIGPTGAAPNPGGPLLHTSDVAGGDDAATPDHLVPAATPAPPAAPAAGTVRKNPPRSPQS